MPWIRSSDRFATPAARSVATAPSTTSGVARRSSTASSGAWNDCAPSDTRMPRAASTAASSGVTVSGLHSTVRSAASGSPRRSRSSSAGPSSVGVPPPTNTVSTPVGSSPLRPSSASSASTYGAVPVARDRSP